MSTRRAPPAITLLTAHLLLVAPVAAQETLDLSLQPGDVAEHQAPAAVDAEDAAPAWDEPGPGEPGWSVRPEVELDVEAGSEDGMIGSLEPELESLGVRLQRTW